ncbi:Clp protease N-terminal domain-containing protein [Sinosporangium siamense]|uniref:Clp R domain-containing protein n=1 Tax=Sinosporangium siamense TaxID=1367973 RepID=A0A919V529_9ACTN|nr:Clp protease N-terminal domain-containing protein [Sinosporangium siamense]GII92550.1 hypothetical protein Ssi02_27810 [Sinosporangium siamense]
MTTFQRYFHTIITEGGVEAQRDGAATIEACHLLLAVAAQEGTAPQRLLAEAGLDHQGVRAALQREFEHSLNSVGVSTAAFTMPRPSPALKRPSGMGASGRQVLDRIFTGNRKKDLRPMHVLIAILRAEVGKVPRALDLTGVDRAGLLARAVEDVTNTTE